MLTASTLNTKKKKKCIQKECLLYAELSEERGLLSKAKANRESGRLRVFSHVPWRGAACMGIVALLGMWEPRQLTVQGFC